MDKIRYVKDFGQFVRQARKAQGLTQEDVAGMTNIGRRFISDLEGGKETIHMGKALSICAALGVAVSLDAKWMK